MIRVDKNDRTNDNLVQYVYRLRVVNLKLKHVFVQRRQSISVCDHTTKLEIRGAT